MRRSNIVGYLLTIVTLSVTIVNISPSKPPTPEGDILTIVTQAEVFFYFFRAYCHAGIFDEK